MLKYPTIITLALCLSACGASESDRAISGAGIGAAGSAILGANPVTGAAIGAAAGALTDEEDIDLGKPFWR